MGLAMCDFGKVFLENAYGPSRAAVRDLPDDVADDVIQDAAVKIVKQVNLHGADAVANAKNPAYVSKTLKSSCSDYYKSPVKSDARAGITEKPLEEEIHRLDIGEQHEPIGRLGDQTYLPLDARTRRPLNPSDSTSSDAEYETMPDWNELYGQMVEAIERELNVRLTPEALHEFLYCMTKDELEGNRVFLKGITQKYGFSRRDRDILSELKAKGPEEFAYRFLLPALTQEAGLKE